MWVRMEESVRSKIWGLNRGSVRVKMEVSVRVKIEGSVRVNKIEESVRVNKMEEV